MVPLRRSPRQLASLLASLLPSLLCALIPALLSACEAAPERACVPGSSSLCACDDGAVGAQVCEDDGSGLLPCSCASASASAGAGAGESDAGADGGPTDIAGGSGPAALAVEPSHLVFSDVPVGEVSSQTLTLSNHGVGTLVITHVGFTGSDQIALQLGDLYANPTGSLLLSPPVTVAPGESVDAIVAYAPRSEGLADATLVLFTNDPSYPLGLAVPIEAGLSGPCIDVASEEVDFGSVAAGGEGTRTLTLRSCGGEALAITRIALDPSSSAAAFAVDLSLLPGGDEASPASPLIVDDPAPVALLLRYAPPAQSPLDGDGTPIPDEGTLIIESNGGPPVQVHLTGQAVDASTPQAVATADEGALVIPQTVLHLRSEGSLASPGPVARYEWTVDQPAGSASTFKPSATAPNPTFEVNVAGTYTFSLAVWDAYEQPSAPASLQVVVIPDEAVHIELLWDTPNDPDQSDEGPEAGADMDLHFTHPYAGGSELPYPGADLDGDGVPDGWFDQPFDCFWFNPNPNWGSFDPAVPDDPGLDRDDTDGAGPENLNLDLPEDDKTYRIGVHYWHDHKFGPSYATLRVYIYGELVWEREDVKLENHDLWEAATLKWPSGEVEAVEQSGGGDKITPNYENPFFFQP